MLWFSTPGRKAKQTRHMIDCKNRHAEATSLSAFQAEGMR